MTAPQGWLLLIHQIPPRPLYLRAQVRRRLTQVGALPLKNSVYVLPDRPDCLEDFQWIAQEATAGGGEASVCRARFVSGATDTDLQTRFRETAAARFAPITATLKQRLADSRRSRASPPADSSDLERVQRAFDAAARTDFFHSDAGTEADTLMNALKAALQPSARKRGGPHADVSELRGRVWVTRRDPHVDRLATAWLIRRFVDPAARFRFLDPSTTGPVRSGEKSFDFVGADFTHEGDRCSFETMCERLALKDKGLRHLAEIVHDLDLKDDKFGRPDAAGVDRLIEGLVASHADSLARINAGMPIFDALFASFGGTLPKLSAPVRPRPRAKGTR